MSKRKTKGQQLDTINREGNLFQASFNLEKQDEFVTGLGIDLVHYKAMPSPIGMKDKGDYRKPDKLDVLSSNGMIYTKAGCFTAAMVGNSRSQARSETGFVDQSVSRLVMPRFYNKQDEQSNADRIYMSPGDRVYVADPNADVLVPNYQRMEFEADQDNRPMFPICKVEQLIDSLGNFYTQEVDFTITPKGDIRWLSGGKNPEIDPDTKKGRIYSVRYLYKAFWYVIQIPNEVRITNVTDEETRSPQRMANHVVIQREYVYQDQANGNRSEVEKAAFPNKKRDDPIQPIQAPDAIKVNMSYFDDESE